MMREAAAARYEMLPVTRAKEIIAGFCRPLPVERVPLDQAQGHTLAETAHAPEPAPPFRSAAVDGYAVRAADGAAERRVTGEILAGSAVALRLGPGEAAWVTTGAPLPEGADAMVMVEVTERHGGRVRVQRAPRAGDGFHPIGQDLSAGQVVLEAGVPLGPAEIGLLAAIGIWEAPVHRRPRVAVLSTGDELVEPWTPRAGAAIRDSNRFSIMAAVREAGGEPVSLGIARDEEAEQESAIRRGLEQADVVITSAGVSMGNRDLIKEILERLGQIHIGRIDFKPGKPLTFATAGDRLIFGLPGFPVSSLVTFEVFVRPALLQLQGRARPERPRVRVALEHAVRPSRDRVEYQRARVSARDGCLQATTTGLQASSRLLSMAGANALIVIPAGDSPLAAGSEVEALLLGPPEA
jgi:molybdopterin molybdotransferase